MNLVSHATAENINDYNTLRAGLEMLKPEQGLNPKQKKINSYFSTITEIVVYNYNSNIKMFKYISFIHMKNIPDFV